MKKGLSLKKRVPTDAPKDQKSITSFFKKIDHTKIEPTHKEKTPQKRSLSSPKEFNLLLKGKHSISDDQKVPDLSEQSNQQSSKRLKLSPKLKQIDLNYCNEVVDVDNSLAQQKQYHIHNETNSVLKTPEKVLAKSLQIRKPNEMKILSNIVGEVSEKRLVGISKNYTSPIKDNLGCIKDVDNLILDDSWDNEDHFKINELDLSVWQRCTVIEVVKYRNELKLKLQDKQGNTGECLVSGTWTTLQIEVGSILSLIASKDDECFKVSNDGGFIVLWPDHLLSSTTIVGSVFCSRRTVLQESFRGFEPANRIMTVGSLVHELFQISLEKNLKSNDEVKRACEQMLSSYKGIHMLYDADISFDEAVSEMNKFVPQIVDFVSNYVGQSKSKKIERGNIDSVLDIEENLYCPTLGVKGKIDVTLQIKNGSDKISPLELKTGRASVSVEHRGQLILYGMMLAVIEAERYDPKVENSLKGMLLYLRDKITLKEVSSVYPERRDLIMLRNQLAQHLHSQTSKKKPPKNLSTEVLNKENDSQNINCESKRSETKRSNCETNVKCETKLCETKRFNCEANVKCETDVEDLNLDLPEPINHHSACGKCPYLTICSVYLWNTTKHKVSDSNPLSKLKQEAIGHLTKQHVDYFMHWVTLLLTEDSDKITQNSVTDLWTKSAEERENRGKCLKSLVLKKVQEENGKNIHTFARKDKSSGSMENAFLSKGDYVVISTDTRVNLSSGHITKIDCDQLCIALDRNLTKRNKSDVLYHIDSYESQSQNIFNFTNLGALMDNSEDATRLRRFIIEKSEPFFAAKLPRKVSELSVKLLKNFNRLQQRAILRAIAAEDYLLIKGMPGTGKTQTVSVLIQMLVALGNSVLVTSQTHSAIDNVLVRLPPETNIIRLGPTERIHPDLLLKSEEAQTSHFRDPAQLIKWSESALVVGVTCLGAAHTVLSKRKFDVCIVDESTQVLQPTVLRALFAAKKFILIGDPNQLPPIVRSPFARKLGMDVSLFEHLDNESTVNLSLQYRMNKTITDLANRFVYENQLKCANEEVANACLEFSDTELTTKLPDWLSKCLSSKLEESVQILDTGSTADCQLSSCDGNGRQIVCQNTAEAAIVLHLVDVLIQKGINPKEIGVITPYRDQVSLLTRLLPFKGVEVNTVDQYQGRDKTVVVYSCCKTWNYDKGEFVVKDTEILEDKRRLTVAITRAKRKLILIGDVRTLNKYTTFSRLFKNVREMNQLCNEMRFISFDKTDLKELYDIYKIK